jgi:hypothetical protein
MRHLLLLLFPIIVFNSANSQGWRKTFGTAANYESCRDVDRTADGGFVLLCGKAAPNSYADVLLVKTDANGVQQWQRTYNQIQSDNPVSVCGLSNGDIAFSNSVSPSSYLTKVNSLGDTLWKKFFLNIFIFNMIQDASGNIVCIATKNNPNGNWTTSYDSLCFMKISPAGNVLLKRCYVFSGCDQHSGNSIKQTSDNGYIVCGMCEPGTGTGGAFLCKLDNSGNLTWVNKYFEYSNPPIEPVPSGYDVVETVDGYALSGIYYHDMLLLKTNFSGNLIWSKTWQLGYIAFGRALATDNSGNLFICGNGEDEMYGINDIVFIKVNSQGQEKFLKRFGLPYKEDKGTNLIHLPTGENVLAGTTTSYGAGLEDAILIKTDSIGNIYSNTISGRVYTDMNGDCNLNSGDAGLAGRIIKLTPGPEYTMTDNAGYYQFNVNPGSYIISQSSAGIYYSQPCTNSFNVNVSSANSQVTNINFSNQITTLCSYMSVDLSLGLTRKCFRGNIQVNYCNQGTAPANAFIDIDLAPEIVLLGAALPYSSIGVNKYRFQLGYVQPGFCGSFFIQDSISCSTNFNQTLCGTAHIFPDSVCTTTSTIWDHSSLTLKGGCENDSVRFVLTNTGAIGTGDMQGTSVYRVYSNQQLISTQTFQLAGQDSLVLMLSACGNTIRLEADQRPGHPGQSHPSKSVEGCGSNCGTITYGQVNSTPLDDLDDSIEEDCQVVRSSFDPNEKLVSPSGVYTQHYIKTGDELEYTINFQNTGNDTAFKIVVIDTLSQFVDPLTFRSGVSSAPYTVEMSESGIVKWTFNNILLPDHLTNELKSHGFVKFKIAQKSTNQPGIQIKNRASIFFDYNYPILTAYAFNTVSDLPLSTKTLVKNHAKAVISPNPFTSEAVVTLTNGESLEGKEIRILDLLNKVKLKETIKSVTYNINASKLDKGGYLLEIVDKQRGIIAVERIVVM